MKRLVNEPGSTLPYNGVYLSSKQSARLIVFGGNTGWVLESFHNSGYWGMTGGHYKPKVDGPRWPAPTVLARNCWREYCEESKAVGAWRVWNSGGNLEDQIGRWQEKNRNHDKKAVNKTPHHIIPPLLSSALDTQGIVGYLIPTPRIIILNFHTIHRQFVGFSPAPLCH